MFDDDDEAELAALRAERKARLGDVAGATRGELQKAYAAGNSDDDATSDGNGEQLPTDESLEDAGIPAALIEQGFPMAFGKQVKQPSNAAAIHEATIRAEAPSVGPPHSAPSSSARPDHSFSAHTSGSRTAAAPAEMDSFVGPPRPQRTGAAAESFVGPPRPQPAAAVVDSFVGPPRPQPTGAAADSFVGPPRPQPAGAADDLNAGPLRASAAIPHSDDSFAGPPRPPVASNAPDAFVGPPRPAAGQPASQPDDSSDVVGPLRPPQASAAEPSVGPPRPPGMSQAALQDASVGPSRPPPVPRFEAAVEAAPRTRPSHDSDDDYVPPRLPMSNEIRLKAHFKVVSAIDIDRTGSRVITGGYDYNLRMFDFNGMKSDFKPFRELQPSDGHPVNALSFSPTGDAFLCVMGSSQPKIYDRDGRELGQFKRGDMYLRDLRNTKGHVSGCTHGQWNPKDRFTAMTASNDGTVRLWDAEKIEQKMVIKPSIVKPGRIPVTACCYSPDASLIGAALTDGTIQLWSASGSFGRAANLGVVNAPKAQMLGKPNWKYASGSKQLLRDAHPAGAEVSDLAILRDGRTLLSRSDDETLKVWDLRMFKHAVHVWDGLPLTHSQTRLCVSPQEDIVLTGISGERGAGVVVALDLKNHDLICRIGMPGTVTNIKWNASINQILVGTGDRTHGATHVLYDPMMSEKGALLCAGKRPRVKDSLDFMPAPTIHNPGALPMFRDDFSRKRKREPDSKDTRAAKVPEGAPTMSGPGGGGRIGSTSKTLLTQYLLEKGGMKRLEEQMDPREAILRHKNADEELAAWTKAYSKTQPNRIYAEPEEEADNKK